MQRAFLPAWIISLLAIGSCWAQDRPIEVMVTANADMKTAVKNMPVVVPMEVSPKLAKTTHVRLKGLFSDSVIGQLTEPGLLTRDIPLKDKGLVRRDLHCIIPVFMPRTSQVFRLEPLENADKLKVFHWHDTKGDHADLSRGAQPVLRYMYRAYDNSNEANRNKTYKVFHHLFDPSGTRLVTNGGETDPGAEGKKLLYPHHRGLMFAFNKITYDGGKTADTWHAKPKDTHQSHQGFLSTEAGAVLGRHRMAVDWHGPDSEVFAKEEREVTVYAVDGGTLVEFASRLKSAGGKVRLDGDPQHAGFQFRAANAVVDAAKQTYYLRPDGKGKPGETRNWEPKTKSGPVNLPWDAMSFVLDGKRYTALYIDHPKNPGEKRYSERDYGRFGCYFEYDLTPEHPLVLNYRIWLQNGEMTGGQAEVLRADFVAPPKVMVK
jgi:hypothetical protein